MTLLMVGIRWILPGFRVNSALVKWCRFIMRVLTVSSTITESHKNNGYAQSPKGGGVAELFLLLKRLRVGLGRLCHNLLSF